jgi:hypothetical protein
MCVRTAGKRDEKQSRQSDKTSKGDAAENGTLGAGPNLFLLDAGFGFQCFRPWNQCASYSIAPKDLWLASVFRFCQFNKM